MKTDETKEKMSQLVEQMRRKQSMQHLDQRQILLLENAYYQVSNFLLRVQNCLALTHICQCNPPERAPRQEKVRTPLELFIRHLVYDVLAKRTIDKVLKLMRKLDWNDPEVKICFVFEIAKVLTVPSTHTGVQSLTPCLYKALETSLLQHWPARYAHL
jgi:regulator of nonsense transcripts 2